MTKEIAELDELLEYAESAMADGYPYEVIDGSLALTVKALRAYRASLEPSAATEVRPILTCNEALIEKLRDVAIETDDGEASDALYDAAAALTGLMGTGPRDPDNDLVICPTCTSQFRAIPVNVQKLMATAAVMVRDTGVCRADGLNRREVFEQLTASYALAEDINGRDCEIAFNAVLHYVGSETAHLSPAEQYNVFKRVTRSLENDCDEMMRTASASENRTSAHE
jgi:hypothetical protein